eukprot:jgi/Bigna1/39717/e_gw1.35.75.1
MGGPKASACEVITAIAAYVLTSSTLVFANKFLMSPEISIPAPLLVTWFQCVVTKAFIPLYLSPPSNPLGTPGTTGNKPSKPPKMKGILGGPACFGMSCAFVLMISLTNICLKFVEVSFYQVARGLTPVINSMLSYILLGDLTSTPTALCLFVILAGYYLGIKGEIKFSLLGTIFGFSSSLCCVLYPILTRKRMDALNDKWAVIFYNNAHAALMFVPLIGIFETQIIIEHQAKLRNPLFWLLVVVIGDENRRSFVGVAAVTQLKLTSPLSHNVIGNAKGAAQSIVGAYIWRTPLTLHGVIGLGTVLGGSLLYAYCRLQEKKVLDAACRPSVKHCYPHVRRPTHAR